MSDTRAKLRGCVYRFTAKLLHRFDLHHTRRFGPLEPDGVILHRCEWCGVSRTETPLSVTLRKMREAAMPESVSGVPEILNQLRESSVGVLVGLASAETAVRAAADARTAEIVAHLTDYAARVAGIDEPLAQRRANYYAEAANFLARCFPNGGTHE